MKRERLNELSEGQLLVQISRDNELAFTEIYNRHWRGLFLLACNVLQEEEAAKDVVQEIFVSLWQRRKDILIENLNAYLTSSVKRKVLQYLRNDKIAQRHLERIHSLERPDNPGGRELDFYEASEELKKYINRLPERCKEVFLLSRYEQLSHKAIAEKLNISTKTVEIHITKALKYLRSSLTDH